MRSIHQESQQIEKTGGRITAKLKAKCGKPCGKSREIPDIAVVCLTTYNPWCCVCYSTKGGDFVQEKRYQRDRQWVWDRRNLRTVSTHLTVEEAERLKIYCNRRGISKYYLIRQLLREAMAADRT